MFSSIPWRKRVNISWKSRSSSPVGSSSATVIRVLRWGISSSRTIALRSTHSPATSASSRTFILASFAATFFSGFACGRADTGPPTPTRWAGHARRRDPIGPQGSAGPSPWLYRDRLLGGPLVFPGEQGRAGLLCPAHAPVEPQVDEAGLPSRRDRGVLIRLDDAGRREGLVGERLVVHFLAPVDRGDVEVRLELEGRHLHNRLALRRVRLG